MASVERVELWSDVQAGGGVRRAIVTNLLALDESVTGGGEHTVHLEVTYANPAAVTSDTPAGETNFDGSRVVRLVHRDGTWSEHRIAEHRRLNSGGQLRRRVIARSIWADLATHGMITLYTGGGKRTASFPMLGLTAIEHWTRFIYPALAEAGAPYWDLDMQVSGAIQAQPVDISYDNDSPLSALHKVASALGKLEMSPSAGVDEYVVTMQPQVGAAAAPLVVRARRNLVSLGYTESQTDQATRIYPTGTDDGSGRATMGEAEWHPLGPLPTRTPHPIAPTTEELITIQLVDEAGGPGPVQFAEQWKPELGRYHYALQWVTAAFSLAIYSADPAAQSVTLLGAPGQVIPHEAWHRVKFVRSTTSPIAPGYEEVNYVDHPTMRDRYHVLVGHIEVPDVPPTNNIVPNPLMRHWKAGTDHPDGWFVSPGATAERETLPGDWMTAGQALRVVLPVGGEVATPFTLMPQAPSGFLSFFGKIKVLSGQLRLSLLLSSATIDPQSGSITSATNIARVPDDIAGLPLLVARTNLWTDLGIAAVWDYGQDPVPSYGQLSVRFTNNDSTPGSTVEAIIDAAQITNTPDQRPLLEGNAGVRLFQAGNEHLLRYAEPAVSIEANLLDLAAFDPVRFVYDEIILGGAVHVVDPETGVSAATRITGWTRDWLRQTNTSISISSARSDLTSRLAHPRAPARA